jgi:hypothetical protein
MSVQVKHRRDIAANIATFTPAQGELIVDTTNNRVLVGDGVTAGGWAAAKLSEVQTATRRALADVSTVALSSDRLIAYASLTAARAVTLPAASAFPPGAVLTVIDESGACSPSKAITLARAGADTVNGAASVALLSAYGYVALESNGSNAWTILDGGVGATLTAAASPNGATMTLNVLEQIVSGLTGASVTASVQIPAGALVLACAARTVTTVTGATSFSVGYAGSTSAFGSGLGVASGSTNQGMIGPNPFYSATNLILTAAGGNFTAGAVRLALVYLTYTPPVS